MEISLINLNDAGLSFSIIKEEILRKPQLNNDKHLKDYGIDYESVITIIDSPNYSFHIHDNPGISNLKRVIKKKNNFECEYKIKLFFGGKELTEEYCSIINHSVIFFDVIFHCFLFIKTLTGKTLEIPFRNASTTINEIKKSIGKMERIPVDQQRLIFSGRQLDDSKSLQDCNIANKSTLYLVLRLKGGTLFYIKMADGTIISIGGSAGMKVTNFKMCLWCKCNVVPSRQKLLYKGTLIAGDDAKMEDFNIGFNDVIDLEILEESFATEIIVKCLNSGTFFPINIKVHSAKVEELKKEIAKQKYIAVENQLIFF